MGERSKSFAQLLLAGLLSGSVIAAVLGFILHGQTTKVEEEVRSQFKTAFEVFRSQHDWKKQSLAELLGPINMQLRRTKLAFMRWDDLNLYLEMKIIARGNDTARDLLLNKGYLIPPELMDCASELIEHYDVWLEKYERERVSQQPDLETKFIFTGPDGYPFPSACATRFQQKYEALWKEVYGRG